MVSVVTDAARYHFPTQARVFVDLEHVDTDVGHAGSESDVQRLAPACGGLARKSRDEIDADVVNAGGAEPINIGEDSFAIVHPADGAGFGVDKRLHAQADAIHSVA